MGVDIKADRAIIAAATPGPWRQGYTLLTTQTQRWSKEEWDGNERREKRWVFHHFIDDASGRGREAICETRPEVIGDNAAFIAAARTRWPLALDEIERLTGYIETIGQGIAPFKARAEAAEARVAELEPLVRETYPIDLVCRAQRAEARVKELVAEVDRIDALRMRFAEECVAKENRIAALTEALKEIANSQKWGEDTAIKRTIRGLQDSARAALAAVEGKP